MDALQQWWVGVMEVPGARWIVWGSLLAALLLTAFYILQFIRNLAVGSSGTSHDHLGEFRKMRNAGKLDDSEYKRLTGVIPIPDIVPDKSESAPTGDQALTAAAKEAIQKAAKNKATSPAAPHDDAATPDDGTRPAAENEPTDS